MNLYEFIFVEPWPWWLGAIAIGLMVPLLYYFLNEALGVSTGYGNLIKMALPKTKLKWLNSETFKRVFNHRFFFMTGIIAGAIISARMAGLVPVTLSMGVFTENVFWPLAYKALWFTLGGLLLGLGARIAGGCTSGHSIHGIANLHLSSVIATIFFILFGVVSVYLIRIFIFGGA
jgi:hypothetical protein